MDFVVSKTKKKSNLTDAVEYVRFSLMTEFGGKNIATHTTRIHTYTHGPPQPRLTAVSNTKHGDADAMCQNVT